MKNPAERPSVSAPFAEGSTHADAREYSDRPAERSIEPGHPAQRRNNAADYFVPKFDDRDGVTSKANRSAGILLPG